MWYEAQKWEYIPTKLGTPVAKVQVAHLSVINPASTFAGVHSFEQYGDYPQKIGEKPQIHWFIIINCQYKLPF